LNRKNQSYEAMVKEYREHQPVLDMKAALSEANKQIKKYGFELLCSVSQVYGYGGLLEGLKFTFI
jgi:hypothetical protein